MKGGLRLECLHKEFSDWEPRVP